MVKILSGMLLMMMSLVRGEVRVGSVPLENMNLSVLIHLKLPMLRISTKFLENIIMKSLDQVSPGGSLLQQLLVVSHQLSLPALDPRHLRLQLLDLIYLPLPAVLRRHLVLPSPPDVSTQSQLLLSQLVLAQQVVELVHGQVDDVSTGDWETHLCCLPLITC